MLWTNISKRGLTFWLICLTGQPVQATSIILLITKHDIVIGTDSKWVGVDPQRGHLDASGTTKKAAIIENRIVVAQSGMERMPGDNGSEYSFEDFVIELQAKAPANATVTQVADLIKLRLARPLPHFERLLAMGLIKPEFLSPPEHNILMRIIVAGFENRSPVVYAVQRGVDWKGLRLQAPSSLREYPDKAHGRKITLQGSTNKGISGLYGGADSAAIRREEQRLPLEYRALSEDGDLSKGGLILLNRSLLDLDVEASPENVGYPLTVFAISPTSVSTKHYNNFDER